MSARRIALAVLAALVVLAGCDNGKEPTFQGWVEADLIFVSPDETGRIETLTVREGDQVEQRALAVHARRRSAARRRRHAGGHGRTTRSRPIDRAQALLKSQSGTQKALRRCRGRAAHRAGAAQLGADPAGAPQGVQPGRRHASSRSISAPAKWCRPAGRSSRSCRPAT